MDCLASYIAGVITSVVGLYVWYYWPVDRKHADVDEYVKRRAKR